MAEFVASLIGIASLGAKVSITLHKVVSTLHSAEKDARLIAADISVFACTLTQLSKTISDCRVPEAAQLFEIAQSLVPACSALVDELHKLIGNTEMYQMKGTFWMHVLALRFRWLLNGPRVAFVKGLIADFKSTLVLLISTMDLAVVIHQDAHHDVKESLKSQVQTNIYLAKDAKAQLLLLKGPQTSGDIPAISNSPDNRSTASDATSSAMTLIDPPSESLVPYIEETPNIEERILLNPIVLDGEETELTCLSQCSPEIQGILIAQEQTLNLAEQVLSLASVPTWRWGSPPATGPSESRTHTSSAHPQNSPSEGEGERLANRSARPEPSREERTKVSNNFVQFENQETNGAFVESLDPLQYLDKTQESHQASPKLSQADDLDLRAMIKSILEETLSSQSSERAVPPQVDPDQTVNPKKPAFLTSPFHSEVQDGSERLSKLERIMLAERDDLIRKAALAEADHQANKAKNDADKLAKLELLILAQKEEQLKREEAVEAARQADKAEADAKIAKEAREKALQAQAAAKLLEAAKAAREEAEAKAAKEAEETRTAHENALVEAKAAQEALEKAKKMAEDEAAKIKPSDAPKPPIKFKDAIGRKFSFPWHLCKTWKGMEELIKQAFLHDKKFGERVHAGQYDLIGPDGEIIMPQVWETMVQPDWAITMHMWPEDQVPVKGLRLKAGLSKFFERRPGSTDGGKL